MYLVKPQEVNEINPKNNFAFGKCVNIEVITLSSYLYFLIGSQFIIILNIEINPKKFQS